MTLAGKTWGFRFRLRERLARSWLVIPGIYTATAVALGVGTQPLQAWAGHPFGLTLDESSASAVLQAVASGMIAFTGLVVSVAVVVVQFGAGQYTPRLVLRFRRDPIVKHALGIFIAPAIYALVALTDVNRNPRAPTSTPTSRSSSRSCCCSAPSSHSSC